MTCQPYQRLASFSTYIVLQIMLCKLRSPHEDA
jgi:hypothetical protein